MAVNDIHLDVGELVLTGFPRVDQDAVAASFEHELTRLLHRHGVEAAELTVDVVTDLPPLPATTSARHLGAALAHAVHTGLARRPR